jgi:glycerol-3-phosphate dehydrogenase
MLNGMEVKASARAVVNATGAWADTLRHQAGGLSRIRPLRGSHLVFTNWRLPVAQAVSFLHPIDRRPVFIFPWEGITLVGTTDVDHSASLEMEPKISPDEVMYLMAAVEYQFPSLGIGLDDVISTYAGVRPVIGCGKLNPSEESRDHVIWEEKGLLTVTGGKLTTFRLIALDVLHAIRHRIPEMPDPDHHMPVLNQIDFQLSGCEDLNDHCRRRILGRLGVEALKMVETAKNGEMQSIPGTNYLWAEIRWAARAEGVCHLDDLLLRRTRLGLILPKGAESIFPMVKAICMVELHWTENRWRQELAEYQALWEACYNLPPRDTIPDWKSPLDFAVSQRKSRRKLRKRKIIQRSSLAGLVITLCIFAFAFLWKRGRQSK